MDIEEEIADEISGIQVGSGYYSTTIGIDAAREAATAIMPLVRRIQAEAGARALRSYRTRLMDQNIDRFGIVLPDLHEVLDDLDEEADRIEGEVEHD